VPWRFLVAGRFSVPSRTHPGDQNLHKSCFVHCSEDKPIQKAGAWRTALSIALRSSSARGSTGNLERMPYQFHRLLDRERVSGPRAIKL
jgi:hypothetical protein